jgi:hypothetical protein
MTSPFTEYVVLPRTQSSRNAELLADVNPVRVFENVAVGVEDFRVKVAIAVILLGNLP